MRPRTQRIEARRRDTEQPYVANRDRPYVRADEGGGVAGEVAAATTDVAGEVLGVDAHRALSGAGDGGPADDLSLLKGVGPKFAVRLNELGINRFEQLAAFGETELAMLDERLGPFRGRLARDRVAEQAHYLARGDRDGFEEKFGKIGAP
jgi:predicted flap endonuclease-1-like 5' DNA nuclease